MKLLLVFLRINHSGVGPENLLPLSIVVAVIFFSLVAYQAAKDDEEDTSIVVLIVLFLGPTILFFGDPAYAISALYGMLVGLLFGTGIKNIKP